jgi:inhibitor of cysteine peptidase
MKKALIISLLSAVLLPVLLLGCQAEEQTPSFAPQSNGGQEAVAKEQTPVPTQPSSVEPKVVQLDISNDEFMSEKNIVKDIEIIKPGSLNVSLSSNATTGFAWSEVATISDPTVIKQESHAYIPPSAGGNPPMVGAAGKETWVFSTLKAGQATISLNYSRPWEGGEKNVQTLTVNVTVK